MVHESNINTLNEENTSPHPSLISSSNYPDHTHGSVSPSTELSSRALNAPLPPSSNVSLYLSTTSSPPLPPLTADLPSLPSSSSHPSVSSVTEMPRTDLDETSTTSESTTLLPATLDNNRHGFDPGIVHLTFTPPSLTSPLQVPQQDLGSSSSNSNSGFSIVTNLSRSLDTYRLRMLLALLPKLQSSLPFQPNIPIHNLALLVKAELRYLIWLKLIASIDARGISSDSIIVPPLDVAFMWLVHLSDTKAYIQDVLRLGGNTLLARSFPLERLYEIVVSLGTEWCDADSERIWQRFAPAEPYRYTYPNNISDHSLPFVCPRCSTTIMIPAVQYIRVRFGTDTIQCSRCQRGGVNIALWSAMLFLNDVRKIAGDASFANFQLKSSQMNPRHVLDPDLTSRFNTHIKTIRFDLQLQSKLRLSINRYWGDTVSLLRSVLADSSLSSLEQTHIVTALINSYGDIVTELSIDLVERSERWIRFVSMVETVTGARGKSTDMSSSGETINDQVIEYFGLKENWIDECCDRYFRLLLLQGTLCEQHHAMQIKLQNRKRRPFSMKMKSSTDTGPKLVIPTFDILVAYTTHMISPEQYYAYSLAHFDQIINFHFYSESAMVKAYTRTTKLWKARYHEEYDLSIPPHLLTLMSRHRWMRLLRLTGKVIMLPISLLVVSTVMLLGGGITAFSAAKAAVAMPVNSPSRRETQVTGRLPRTSMLGVHPILSNAQEPSILSSHTVQT